MIRHVAIVAAIALPMAGTAATSSGRRVAASDPQPRAPCRSPADFTMNVPGQGPSCPIRGGYRVLLANGSTIDTHGPDRAAFLDRTSSAPSTSSTAPAAPAPAPTSAPILCVPSTAKHVELVYSYFKDGTDNFATLAPDIQSQFRDVDANTMNYDAYHYFGHYVHLPVLCNPDGTPHVRDVPLSTNRTASTFSSITSDLQAAGLSSTTAHYWDYTDGNPSSTGVAGEGGYWCASGSTTNCPDDTAGPGNNNNIGPQYATNYGFTEVPSGSTTTTGADVFAHENGHNMGAVALSAPHSTGAGHCTDGLDVMCYDDGGPNGSLYSATVCATAPNGHNLFDCNFDDYFNLSPSTVPYPSTFLSSHWDLGSGDNSWIVRRSINSPADFNGDQLTDRTVYRPSTGTWYTGYSGTSPYSATVWGQPGGSDIPVPADYLHEGQTQDAVYRPSTGDWFLKSTGSSTYQDIVWGRPGATGQPADIPVPGDYDGTGIADVAVFRPGTGEWFVRHHDGTYAVTVWGQNGDIPVPGDYEGAGHADIAVFRPGTGQWFVRHADGSYVATTWGQSGDIPVPGDYDGDGHVDLAVYRPTTARWFSLNSGGTPVYTATTWGSPSSTPVDVPVPGDYDGDGRTDIAIYRPSTGEWFVLPSRGGSYTDTIWGTSGDVPVVLPPGIRQAFF